MKATVPIFDYKNYKSFLQDCFQATRGLQSEVARFLGCQAAYLYQTVKGKAELTDDQSYKVTQYFKFSPLERDYFLNLVRLSKASSSELQVFLRNEIERLKSEALNLKNTSDAFISRDEDKVWDYYFSSSLPSLVHILTSSENFQTVSAIASKLQMSKEPIEECLNSLASFGFVTHKDKKWKFATPSIHLAKDSKYNPILQLMRRSQAMNSILKPDQDSVHFSSLFTLDRKSYDNLRRDISSFVGKSQKLIHDGGTDEAYVMCIDLFQAGV